MQCPKCFKFFHFDEDVILSEIEGCTCDCPHCEAVLIIKNTYALDFHAYIHSKDPRWPVDGFGTGVLEFVS